jgi:hypothetical protein
MALEYQFFQMQDLGFFDIFLPFVLVFTLVFAILQKIKVLGEKSKNFNVVIALVMGMATVVPHVLWGDPTGISPRLANGYYDVVNIINNSLPQVSLVVIIILMALLIIGILGKRFELGNGSLSGWMAALAFLVVGFIFAGAAGWWDYPVWLYFLFSDMNLLALVLVILAFAIIIWFVTKEDKPNDEGAFSKIGKSFGELLKESK